MKITITKPTDSRFVTVLEHVKGVREQLQKLPREEEHIMHIDQGALKVPFFQALLGAVIEQKRRDGFLIRKEEDNRLNIQIFERRLTRDQWESIERRISELKLGSGARNAILYVIGELVENVAEHARSPFGLVDLLSEEDMVYSAVVDVGISIPGAYREGGIRIADDCEALKKALSGVSTKPGERGTGISTSARIIREAFDGTLHLLAGNALLENSKRVQQCGATSLYWQGTAVCGTLQVPTYDVDLYEYVG